VCVFCFFQEILELILCHLIRMCCYLLFVGSMVVSDCIGDTSTTCTSCISETFMSEPSGLKKCFACSHCAKSTFTFFCVFLLPLKLVFFAFLPLYESVANYAVLGQGLDIQSKCTKIRDTICEVLDGYYCIDYSNSQCSHAIKHSVCKPGQEIKTPGIVSQCLKTMFNFPHII